MIAKSKRGCPFFLLKLQSVIIYSLIKGILFSDKSLAIFSSPFDFIQPQEYVLPDVKL